MIIDDTDLNSVKTKGRTIDLNLESVNEVGKVDSKEQILDNFAVSSDIMSVVNDMIQITDSSVTSVEIINEGRTIEMDSSNKISRNCKNSFDNENSKLLANESSNDSLPDIADLPNNEQCYPKIEANKKVDINEYSTALGDSPIKVKRKKCRNILDDDEDSTNLNVENQQNGTKENFNLDSVIESNEPKNCYKNFNEKSEPVEESIDNLSDHTDAEENSPIKSKSDLQYEDEAFCKSSKKSLPREVKGKELMKQSLSLPYFQLPKPDFKQYIVETNKRLDESIQDITSDLNKNDKPNKIMLKPVNNIVFEIGPPRMDKVELFRKRVLGKMSSCKTSKAEANNKIGLVYPKNVPKPIGADRMSWKRKLLNDIAKKKEAALKERNEMLEEVMEDKEEDIQSYIESENEETVEDDVIDVDLRNIDSMVTAPQKNNFNVSFSEISKGVHQDNSHTLFSDDINKDWEMEKDIESSPLCFSLPSFQPNGGFSKSVNYSSSNIFSTSQMNISFNESTFLKESEDLSTLNPSDLKILNLSASASQDDEIVYDKVLAKENLLVGEQNISQDMSADILDICSGQFMDEVEVPKTPPLPNLSADEESDLEVSDNDHHSDHPAESGSDSDSDEDLKFKRKVLKKRIRPISPIDEESRHGEEDTQVHPSAELLVSHTNFDFSKNVLSSPAKQTLNSDDDDQTAVENQTTLIYNSDESLINYEEIPSKDKSKVVQDYFDREAELSGEEGSSDEDERDLDGDEELLIEDGDLPENEEIRDQIGTLHLKHLLDDDDQMIRQVKNHFLEEGEFYSDVTRQRKFNWSFNQTETLNKTYSSGSDNEDEVGDTQFLQDKLKWIQEKANINVVNVEEDIEAEPLDTSLKTAIRKKISTQIVAEGLARNVNKRPRNSFLEEDESKRSFKRIKLDITNAQGTRVTKNFVFVETNSQTKKKATISKNTVDSSVFDLI